MAKTYDKKINRDTAWGGDFSTSGLPVAGGRVQEFIKDELKSKAGSFYKPAGGGMVYCFATKEDKDTYILDPENHQDLILDTFETESIHSVVVNGDTLERNKSIIKGTTGSTIGFQFTIVNKEGFVSDSRASITFTFRASGNVQKYTMEIPIKSEGWTTVTSPVIDKYLRDGENTIDIDIRGISTNAMTKAVLTYNVFDFEFIVDNFSYNTPKNNTLQIPYRIKCSEIKYLEFYIDGVEVNSVEGQTIVDSEKDGRATINITNLTNGQHSLQVRSYIKVKDSPNFYSDSYYYTFAKDGSSTPSFLMAIKLDNTQEIALDGNALKINAEQFEQISFDWSMYDTMGRRFTVNFEYDGEILSRVLFTSNGTVNTFTFRPFNYGQNKSLRIYALGENGVVLFETNVLFDIEGNNSGLKETVDRLLLKLSANGRRNTDEHKDVWTCTGADQRVYSATFHNFAWNALQGWDADSEALVISDDAYVTFDIRPMIQDWKVKGGTFEVDLETFDIEDEDSVICECQSHIPGSSTAYFKITATNAEFSTANGKVINTRYKDGERLKIAFIGNPTGTTEDCNLLYIVVNGVLERAVLYNDSDSIWSNEYLKIGTGNGGCKVKLRSIRIYDRAISVDEEFNNYVVDSDDSQLIYEKNNIFKNNTKEIGFDEIANKLPVMIFTGDMDDLVKNGQDKEWRTFDVEYINRQEPERNFVAFNCEMKLQGTSSLGYPRKNFKLKTKNKLSTEQNYALLNYELDEESTKQPGNIRLRDKETGNLIDVGDYTGGCLTFGCVAADNGVIWKLLEKGKYRFRAGAHKTTKWTLKADYMESSCSHNVGAGRSWNEIFKMAKLPNEFPGYKNNTYKKRALIDSNPYRIYTRADGSVCKININTDSMREQDDFVCRTDSQKICVAEGLGGDYVRTAVDGFPMVCFYRTNHRENKLIFIGQYNFINDKAAYEVFGFEDIEDPNDDSENPVLFYDASKVECWEGLKNTSRISLFKTVDGWTGDEGWAATFESRYPELKDDDGDSGKRQPNARVGSPLYELCNWLVSTRHVDGETVYSGTITIDASFAKRINDYEYAYPNPNDVSPSELVKYYYLPNNVSSVTVTDNAENRQRKFEVEKWEHFDVWKLAGYYIYLMRYGAVDQFVKNTMLFTDGNGNYDTRTDNKYRKWFYINYDNDCLFGLRNNGQLAFHWNLDRQTLDNGAGGIIEDENTSKIYVVYDADGYIVGRYFTEIEAQANLPEGGYIVEEDSEDETVNTYAMMGHDSTLWNNLEQDEEFMRMVRDLDDAMNKAGLNYNNMVTEFDTNQTEQWCERIYNANERYKYIQAAKGVGDMEGNPVDNLWMLQGTRRSHRHWWIANHFNMLDARWLSGEYKRYYMQIKTDAPAGSVIRAVAGDDYYFAWGQQKRIYESNIRKNKGEEILFVLPDIFDAQTQGDPVYIYAYNKMSELDLSEIANKMGLGSFEFYEGDISVVNTLKKFIIGSPLRVNNAEITTSTWAKLVNLEYLDITNFTGISTIPYQGLRNLHTLKALGSGLSNFEPVNGSRFDLVELPTELKTLALDNVVFSNIFENLQYTPNVVLKNMSLDNTNGLGMEYFTKLVGPWLTELNAASGGSDDLYWISSLNLNNVDWKFSNFSNVELFENISRVSNQRYAQGESKNFEITGTIDLTPLGSIDMEKIEKIKEIFGENCFNKDESAIFIRVPQSIFIYSDNDSMVAGNTNIFRRNIYPAENALPGDYGINYYIVEKTTPDDDQAYYDAINREYYRIVNDITTKRPGISLVDGRDENGKQIGILSSEENEYPDTDLKVMALLYWYGGSVKTISVCDFKIIKPTYATTVSISGEKSLYKGNEYIMEAVLKDVLGKTPTGTENVTWTISLNDINRYLLAYENVDEHGIRFRIVTSNTEQPDEENISEDITLSVLVEHGNGGRPLTSTYVCMLLNENVIMTRETNRVMVDVCNNTWPSIFSNPNAITKAQAASITNIGTAFQGIQASSAFKFNEFKHFTGVTSLPDGAFDSCAFLTEISLPLTITGMGMSVFSSCRRLEKISFGNNEYTLPNVSVIRGMSFRGCENLKKLRLPNSVVEIDDFAFGGTGFKKVLLSTDALGDETLLLPSGITTIQGSAFETATWSPNGSSNKLTTFTIPKTLIMTTEASRNILRGRYYTQYLIEYGCSGYISEDGVLYSTNDGFSKYGLIKYPAAKNETIKDVELSEIFEISSYAFLYCQNIGKVTVPGSVSENLLNHAFEGSAIHVVDLGSAISLTNIPDYCFENCMVLTDVILPNSTQINRIGTHAFYNCTNLTGLTLRDGVTELGAGGSVFYNCAFESLTLPDTILTMPKDTIYFCQNLEHLVLPKYVNVNENLGIYEGMVRDCGNLRDVVLPIFSHYENITYNLYDAEDKFVRAYESEAMAITEMETNYPDGHIETVYGENTIVNQAMAPNFIISCSNLQEFIMREEDNGIVASVYGNCVYNEITDTLIRVPYGLNTVNIKEGTKHIGGFSFRGCNSIHTVNIPNTVLSIGDYAFMESSLETITIPNTVTTVGGRCFLRCSDLRSILVGSNVNWISYLAFAGCVNLVELYFLNKTAARLDCTAGSSYYHPFGDSSSRYAGYSHRHDGTNSIYIPYNSVGYDNPGDEQGNSRWVGDPITNADMCGYSYDYVPYEETFIVKIYDENGTLVTNNVYAKSQRGEFVSNGNDYCVGVYIPESDGNVFTSSNDELYHGETVKLYSNSSCLDEDLLGEIEITYGVTKYQIGNIGFGLRGAVSSQSDDEYITLTKSEYETIMSNLELLNKIVICK